LETDPDLCIYPILVNVLIYRVNITLNSPIKLISYHNTNCKNNSYTQWTNNTLVGAPGYPTYNGLETIQNSLGLSVFATEMNKLRFPFKYDYAVAVTA
jgi:hypothetical protein